MLEKTLLKIAVAVGVIGIAVLFILSQGIHVDDEMISRLDGMIDSSVIVTGSVIGVNELESVTFVMIQKDEILTVALFGPVPSLEIGDLVQIRGKVAEHEGETELIGEEVRVI